MQQEQEHYEVSNAIIHSILRLVGVTHYKEVLNKVNSTVEAELEKNGHKSWFEIWKKVKQAVQTRLSHVKNMHAIDVDESKKYWQKSPDDIISEALIAMRRQANPKNCMKKSILKNFDIVKSKKKRVR